MIAICPNPFRDVDLSLTKQVTELLREQGFTAAVCPIFADEAPEVLPDDLAYDTIENIAPQCSLAIVIGGDGTILTAARKIHHYDLPLLGVNLGTMGFMAYLEKEDLPRIADAAKGKLKYSRRMKLDVEVIRGGKTICTDCALNDAVIHGSGDCIRLTASCGGDTVLAFSGDGIVLATPTGSTGYSLSAGGPIVEPDAENIIISPICPHSMSNRSFILAPDKIIEVKTERLHGRTAYLSVDGNSVCDIENGDILRVKRSEHYTIMADLGIRSFYEIAFNKLI